ncbi:uncharacterized protein AMSG_02052 [Thecamonas trahens ATCC 50062]|uniref:Uncharacterized protein n=1 Tax=Thecamonas trahens ATCC 50062 TaxID=461836 RepID=A0A0L0DUY6_THETB|nr:hypothetical protein AMSG_02052 [Thecamonas trahens ATCC 50062]KNC56040.1 hypothetical protein AMSG_02052 [Thecamonas trahens ATCC 50062]|eukprot:XP_013761084.1 hypothetical protein AMSG_02052 [Thecamonas trahens ATCC 50062]
MSHPEYSDSDSEGDDTFLDGDDEVGPGQLAAAGQSADGQGLAAEAKPRRKRSMLDYPDKIVALLEGEPPVPSGAPPVAKAAVDGDGAGLMAAAAAAAVAAGPGPEPGTSAVAGRVPVAPGVQIRRGERRISKGSFVVPDDEDDDDAVAAAATAAVATAAGPSKADA